MVLEIQKGVLVALHTGRQKDAGTLRPEQISFGKLNNVCEAIAICREARTILGGNGVTLDYSPGRHASNLESVRRRAFDTGGRSVVAGALNVVNDVAFNGGRPAQVDTTPFTVGESLAATPGVVVFRNDPFELIQYRPRTEMVHETPLLISPPWINKYYVLDLAPDRSLMEWAVRHNRTIFVIRYRNPDASLRNKTMDDYLVDGLRTALDAVTEITGATKTEQATRTKSGEWR
jgi:poly(3-hydroxyalkanoate) synthetase